MKCKQPTDFSNIKPKFCCACGNSFEQVSVSSVKKPAAPQPPPTPPPVATNNNDDYEREGSEEVLNNASPFELDTFVNPRSTEKMESLAFDKGEKINYSRPKQKRMKKSDIEKQWAEDIRGRNSRNVGGE